MTRAACAPPHSTSLLKTKFFGGDAERFGDVIHGLISINALHVAPVAISREQPADVHARLAPHATSAAPISVG
jgi:hypothetical protein